MYQEPWFDLIAESDAGIEVLPGRIGSGTEVRTIFSFCSAKSLGTLSIMLSNITLLCLKPQVPV